MVAINTVYPVSYTHLGFGNSATLDQWNGKDSTMTVKQFGGGNGAAVDQTASNSSVNAVSYTHLDVYKRQPPVYAIYEKKARTFVRALL